MARSVDLSAAATASAHSGLMAVAVGGASSSCVASSIGGGATPRPWSKPLRARIWPSSVLRWFTMDRCCSRNDVAGAALAPAPAAEAPALPAPRWASASFVAAGCCLADRCARAAERTALAADTSAAMLEKPPEEAAAAAWRADSGTTSGCCLPG